jgi:hypothetical protein
MQFIAMKNAGHEDKAGCGTGAPLYSFLFRGKALARRRAAAHDNPQKLWITLWVCWAKYLLTPMIWAFRSNCSFFHHIKKVYIFHEVIFTPTLLPSFLQVAICCLTSRLAIVHKSLATASEMPFCRAKTRLTSRHATTGGARSPCTN